MLDSGNNSKTNKPWLWKPGQSGNPSGRPKLPVSIVQKLKELLTTQPELADKVASELVNLGTKPNFQQLQAIKELLDRIDGKVAERHKIDLEMPVTIQFVPARELLGDALEMQQDENLGVVEVDNVELLGQGKLDGWLLIVGLARREMEVGWASYDYIGLCSA